MKTMLLFSIIGIVSAAIIATIIQQLIKKLKERQLRKKTSSEELEILDQQETDSLLKNDI